MKIQNETGAVLIVGLVLLLIMTLIGVSATTVTIFDEKLGASLRDKDSSFQAAEAALSAGEAWIKANRSDRVQLSHVKESYKELKVGTVSCIQPSSALWSDANSTELLSSEYDASNGGNETALVQQPRYTREKVGISPMTNVGDHSNGQPYRVTYRITSRATGRATNAVGNARSVTVLQSYYSTHSQ